MTAVPPPTVTDRLAEVAKEAARGMASDWYCPSDPGWRRRDCPECVAAVVAAALAPVVSQIAAHLAAEELEAEAAYDDAAPDEQYARYLFANRLRVRAKNLRIDAEDAAAALVAAAPTERTDR